MNNSSITLSEIVKIYFKKEVIDAAENLLTILMLLNVLKVSKT